MKQLFIFTMLMLSISIYQVTAQVSVGLKVSNIYSEQTTERPYKLLSEMINAERFEGKPKNGISISGLFQVDFNKFISVVVEPGFTKEFYLARSDAFFIDFPIFAPVLVNVEDGRILPVDAVYLEAPLKLKLRAPFFKNRIGLFSIIGLNADKFAFNYEKGQPLIQPAQRDSNSGIFKDWNFHRILGFGVDVNFGVHQFFVDCDFLTKLGEDSFNQDYKLKSAQIGIGYMWEI